MRIEILGPLRVVGDDGTDVTPRAMQLRRALVALAAVAPEPLSTGALERVLWPEGASSPNALQAVVSRVRKVVAPGTIEVGPLGYALIGVEVDLAEFDDACADERWLDAERLLRGRPLIDIDDEFAEPVRARVGAAVRNARWRRLSSAVEGSDPRTTVAELERLVVDEPFDEEWWRLLMIALYRSGRTGDALDAFQRARNVLANELGLEPGRELRDAEARVLAGDEPHAATDHEAAPAAMPEQSWTVPAAVATFVGREQELSELAAAIDQHRMVTVVGPGGAGKTTIALEVCRRAGGAAVFVQFAPASDTETIVRALMGSLGIPDNDAAGRPGVGDHPDPMLRVRDVVRGRQVTFVFDNCEHMIDDVARVADAVLTECPDVRMIATSRELLGVRGEHAYVLPPLHAPDATALFRARAADHGFVVGDEDDELVAAICDRLDGLPLAIELAAARLRVRTLVELSAGLEDRFALLTTGPRLAEPRQQTLRAVVDWSHDLLDAEERVVFRRLSTFVGGATLAGAMAVCAGRSDEVPDLTADAVPGVVERLVDKSLVRADRSGTEVRFAMLQTLLEYAGQRLTESGEREHVMLRHAQHVADMLVPALHGLLGHQQGEWFARIASERSNIDSALGTALAMGDAQLALDVTVPLGWYFYMSGDIEPGTEALEGALACDGPTEPRDRALGLGLYAWLLANGPDMERAVAVASEAIALLDRVDDPWVAGLVTNTYAMAEFFAGNLDRTEQLLGLVDDAAAAADDRWITAITSVVKGEIAQFRGDVDAAGRQFAEAASAFEAVGDRFAYALAITEASELAEQRGDYDHAVELLERGIELAGEVGFSGHPLAMRGRLGNVELLRGNVDAAEQQHRSLVADAAASGVPWLHSMARVGLSAVARRRGDLDEAERQLTLAWEVPRSRSVPHMRATVQVARGYLADQAGDHATAFGYQTDALATAIGVGAPRTIAHALEGVAGALALADDADRWRLGARLLGSADRLRVESGGAMPPAERYDVDRAEERLRAALGDDEFESAFALGAAASVAELADAALGSHPSTR